MSANTAKVLSYYEDFTIRVGEDNRAIRSKNDSLEFHYTKKALSEHITANSSVLEVGCGTGYYGMYFADKCKTYVGIDLFPKHIEIFQRKIDEQGLNNLSCCVGDATKLVNIEDNCFDVVCCFGPLYHLPIEDRELVFTECSRVCKLDGVIAFAYINKLGVLAGACILDELTYPNRKANEAVLAFGINDIDAPFYFTTPEEMEAMAIRHGLSKIRNMGTDFFVTKHVVDKMDDDKFALYMEISDEMVRHESCTGMSNHALLLCKKTCI